MYRKYVINLYRLLLLFHFQLTLKPSLVIRVPVYNVAWMAAGPGSVPGAAGYRASAAWDWSRARVHPPPPGGGGGQRQSRANLCRGRAPPPPDALQPARAYYYNVIVYRCEWLPVELFRVNTPPPPPVRCVSSIRIARLAVVCKWICLVLGIIVVPEGSAAIDIAHGCGININFKRALSLSFYSVSPDPMFGARFCSVLIRIHSMYCVRFVLLWIWSVARVTSLQRGPRIIDINIYNPVWETILFGSLLLYITDQNKSKEI